MNDKDMEQLIKNEFDAAAPDDFDAILKKLGEAPKTENNASEPMGKVSEIPGENTYKRRRNRKYGLLAAMLAIVICTGALGYRAVKLPADVIQLDVNPSIELTLNSFGRVLECRAINTDADPIVAGFDLDGKTLPYAVERLTKALVNSGYVAKDKNSVLVSVFSSSEKHADTLAEKTAASISKAARQTDVDAAVLLQSLPKDAPESQENISAGKLALVKSFKDCLPEYDEKSMTKLSINDLCILADDYKNTDVSFAGTERPSTAAYINGQKAQNAANAAWLSAGIKVENISSRITAKNGQMQYIVRAENGGDTLIASVDAVTGNILNSSLDENQYAVSPKPNIPAEQGNVSTPKQTPATTPSDTVTVTPQPTEEPPQFISREDALNLALQAFGVSADSISDVRIDKEKHSGAYVYEVRFEKDTLDYKATVDAVTGEIISMFVF